MSEAMNIYETFNNLRYHYENEVVKFFSRQSGKAEHKKADNSFDFDELGYFFLPD